MNDSVKFGKRSKPSIPATGCYRWKFLRFLTEKFLNEKKAQTKDLTTLIGWGFRLVEYHKKPEYQAALQASPK